MVIQMQKETNVIRLILFLMILLLNSCSSNKNDDDVLLKLYVNDYIRDTGIDSVFLDKNNANKIVWNRYTKYDKNEKGNASILDSVFSEFDSENIKSQTSETGIWNLDQIKKGKFLFLNEDKNVDIIHISKPIYSIDKDYALIYNYLIGNNGVHFIPSIDVYKKMEEFKWKKIHSISSNTF